MKFRFSVDPRIMQFKYLFLPISATMNLEYDANQPIFVPSKGKFAIDDGVAALETALQDREKPLLVYVHGRANKKGEPKKSVKEGIYDALNAYDVNTIGFTWNADDGGYDPDLPAASAPDFLKFLGYLENYFRDQKNSNLAPPTLLTHSMGVIVVSTLAQRGSLGQTKPEIFSNVVLSAPAVVTNDHARWLSDIRIARRIYVTVNEKDKMLWLAGLGKTPDMLGHTLSTPWSNSGRVTYVDVSLLDVNHQYFVKAGQKGQLNLGKFYSDALKGQNLDLNAFSKAGNRDGVPVRVILPNGQNH